MDDHSKLVPSEHATKLLGDYEQAVNAGETEKSMEIAVQFLVHASEIMKNHPGRWQVLVKQADASLRKADWPEAERCYREAVAAAIDEHQRLVSSAYGGLSRYLSLIGRNTEALEAAKAGVETARPHEIYTTTIRALEIQSAMLIKMGKYEAALERAEEALALAPKDPVAALIRGRALVRRANCRVELGQVQESRDDLSEAWTALAPHADSPFSAGGRSGLGAWHQVDAKIWMAEGNIYGAVEAMVRAVNHVRAVDAMPQVAGVYTSNNLAQCLDRYAEILYLAGENAQADDATTESRRIYESIGLPERD